MTIDEKVREWAREAGFSEPAACLYHEHWTAYGDDLVAFALLARADAFEMAADHCYTVERVCLECAAHNDHEVCEYATQGDYACAIRALAVADKEKNDGR